MTTIGLIEGRKQRDAAVALLESTRATLLRKARRAMLRRLLERGSCTADDVAESVEVPPECDGRFLGAVPHGLGKIVRDTRQYVQSRRPGRHAGPIKVWELADAAAAQQWLAENPDTQPKTLFD